jgi:hypothetical protein
MKKLLYIILFLIGCVYAQSNTSSNGGIVSDNGKIFYSLYSSALTMKWNGYVVEERLFENIYSNALLGKKYDPFELDRLNKIIQGKDNIIDLFELRTNFMEVSYGRMRANDLEIIRLKDIQIKTKETIIIVTAIAIPVAFILGILFDRGINITLTTK